MIFDWRSGPGLSSRATARAVQAPVGALLEDLRQERGSADFAGPLDGPAPTTPSFAGDEDFVIAYKIGPSPGRIAAMTGGHQVRQRVVSLVPIQVVDHEIVSHGFALNRPVDRAPTPMARMGTRAEGVVESDPMGTDAPPVSGQGMSRGVAGMVPIWREGPLFLGYHRLRSGFVPALGGAVASLTSNLRGVTQKIGSAFVTLKQDLLGHHVIVQQSKGCTCHG
jgi:hypothetical protein